MELSELLTKSIEYWQDHEHSSKPLQEFLHMNDYEWKFYIKNPKLFCTLQKTNPKFKDLEDLFK